MFSSSPVETVGSDDQRLTAFRPAKRFASRSGVCNNHLTFDPFVYLIFRLQFMSDRQLNGLTLCGIRSMKNTCRRCSRRRE